jgi:hypothetical protein
MIDEDSDWISFHAAVAYVETTLQCHQEKAASLVRQAVNDLELGVERLISARLPDFQSKCA